MAKTIFEDMTGGWDSTCGGGIWWGKTETYKNAIANELFSRWRSACTSARRRTGRRRSRQLPRLGRARMELVLASGMINANNLVNDGLANCVNNGATTWTYNQGVLIGGLVDLAR